MRLTFLGTANAFFSGGRAHGSVLIEDSAGRLLLECGATTPYLLKRNELDPDSIESILVTHLHGDHFGGLAFFLLDAREGGRPRRASLHLIGPPGLAAQVRALVRALYPESEPEPWPFPIQYAEIHPGESATVAGRRIEALRADHMSDRHPALCVRIESEGKIIAFTGDTAARAPLVKLAQGADVFICECTHAHEPAEGSLVQHLSAPEIARLRSSWKAKRVVLTHLTEEARLRAASIPDIEIADDGSELEL